MDEEDRFTHVENTQFHNSSSEEPLIVELSIVEADGNDDDDEDGEDGERENDEEGGENEDEGNRQNEDDDNDDDDDDDDEDDDDVNPDVEVIEEFLDRVGRPLYFDNEDNSRDHTSARILRQGHR